MVSGSVVAVATVLSSLAGYAFGTMRFPGATALFYLLLVGLMVPSEAVVIPLYFTFSSLGLTDTYFAMIAPQIAQSLAFGTFWMRAYFRSSSRELVEAARLDGAGHWRTLWSVLLPLGRPAVLTMVLLTFMWTWNEFLIPLVMVINEPSLSTAPLGLTRFQGQYTSARRCSPPARCWSPSRWSSSTCSSSATSSAACSRAPSRADRIVLDHPCAAGRQGRQ